MAGHIRLLHRPHLKATRETTADPAATGCHHPSTVADHHTCTCTRPHMHTHAHARMHACRYDGLEWREILGRTVQGYVHHLDVRASVVPTLPPTWTDLVMWATLIGSEVRATPHPLHPTPPPHAPRTPRKAPRRTLGLSC